MADQPAEAGPRMSALQDAIREGERERVAALVGEEPALLNARDEQGRTPLGTAVEQRQLEIGALLLAQGADANRTDKHGGAPLHDAIGPGRPAAEIEAWLRLLLAHGADPGIPDDDGRTALRRAIWFGCRPAVRLLTERNAPLHRPRPTREAPAEIVGRVERLLSRAWSGPVTLGRCWQLRGERVLRFEIVNAPAVNGGPAPARVVVKQARGDAEYPYDPDSVDRPTGAWGLFADWAGTQLFSSLPDSSDYALRFYAGDRTAGMIVIEDLGDGEALVDCLMGDDPARAEGGLRMLAECLGRMHAATVGREARYQEYRDALGPRLARDGRQLPDETLKALLEGFDAFQIEPATGFEAELEQVAAAMADPGPFLAYVHGDPCPDNCRIEDGRLRLFDFETGRFRHALLDAVYGRITFPTCWCVNRLPPPVARMMEAAYRAELVKGCPEAGDDRRFERELVHCSAYWCLDGVWRLERARGDDWQWGISTWRQRVLVRLDALADTTEQFGHLPAIGETARRTTARLRQLWPAEADAMPLYPAFRGSGG